MFRSVWIALMLTFAPLAYAKRPEPLPVPIADSLPVEVVFNQRELEVSTDGFGAYLLRDRAPVGQLLGAAIVGSQLDKANAQVAPLREALKGFDFEPVMENALRERLAHADGISPSLTVSFHAAEADADRAAAAPRALVLHPAYLFDNDFDHLMVNIAADLVTREVSANGKVKTQYEFGRVYSYRYPLVRGEGENLDRWKRVPPEQLRALIEAGMRQAADMLVFDFSPEGRSTWDASLRRQDVTVHGEEYHGLAVKQTDDWVWARVLERGHETQTFVGYQPVDETRNTAAAGSAASTPR